MSVEQSHNKFIKNPTMSFANKVILVTGASSGIGADAARHLAKLGGKVALVGRNEIRLNQVCEQIKEAGSITPLAIVADVTVDAERIINETIKYFGKLDILINNAGIAIQDNIVDFNMAEFDLVFNTNVRSVLTLTHLAVPHLEKTKGNIINVSSINGLKPIPPFFSYCISKSALDQITKCVAVDLAPKRIRVNSINPGQIRTPIIEKTGFTDIEKIEENCKNSYLVGRMGEVSDTSAAIEYLASDAASFITGVILPVDGGILISPTAAFGSYVNA